MIDYTILTVISIVALILSICCVISLTVLFKWSDCVDEQLECLQKYINTLDYKITKQRGDFNRSLMVSKDKYKEIDDRLNTLQCRLNQERMKDIINGNIKD